MSDWHRCTSISELDRALAVHIAHRLTEDLNRYGDASLAVSGGTTPAGMFKHLSHCDLDWSRVWLTLVDERCVPVDHPDSNEGMVRNKLLRSRASKARFIGLCGDLAQPIEALQTQLAAIPRPFSAVVMGMGKDGHTASWFPAASNLTQLLDPESDMQLAETDPPSATHKRRTLTLSAVLASREIVIHITGDEKRVVLKEAIAKGYPVASVLKQRASPVSIWWAA